MRSPIRLKTSLEMLSTAISKRWIRTIGSCTRPSNDELLLLCRPWAFGDLYIKDVAHIVGSHSRRRLPADSCNFCKSAYSVYSINSTTWSKCRVTEMLRVSKCFSQSQTTPQILACRPSRPKFPQRYDNQIQVSTEGVSGAITT